jgi:hypothetical protein
VVLALEIRVGDRLDERQRALTRLGEQRLDPSKGRCSGGVDGATR